MHRRNQKIICLDKRRRTGCPAGTEQKINDGATLDSLRTDLAEKENVTEELKSTDQMLWVRKMNNIRNRAEEIVTNELVYE